MKFNWRKILSISAFFIFIFILAVIIWYSPVLFKGYQPFGVNHIINMARNFNEAGIFSLENNLNVVLSSSQILDQGKISGLSNKFTSFLYSGIFNIFGSLSSNSLPLVSIVINALALVIFTIVVSSLFNRKTGFLFALVYIFLPFNWKASYSAGSYEFALIFLALFFLFYFQAEKTKIKSYARISWVLSGIFLTGAIFARDTFILLPIFLLIFLIWKKKRQALIFIIIPLVILMSIFWLPDFIKRSNYFDLVVNTLGLPLEKTTNADYSFYGHLYPDPYTYHFNKDTFLKEGIDEHNSAPVSIEKIEKSKTMENVGANKISVFEKLKVSLVIGFRHIFYFFSLEEVGGPFVFMLMVLGFLYLRKKNKELRLFLLGWVCVSIFLLTFVLLLGRNHLLDFVWAIALTVTLGVILLIKIFLNYFKVEKKKIIYLVQILVLGALIYNFVLANHVLLGRIYDDTSVLEMENYSKLIKSLDISNEDVIALDLHGGSLYHLNYLTDKSMVIFREKTVKSLIEKNELKSAFEEFNIKYIIGYPEDLSNEIIKRTEIVNISSGPIEAVLPDVSRNKGWLMNLMK